MSEPVAEQAGAPRLTRTRTFTAMEAPWLPEPVNLSMLRRWTRSHLASLKNQQNPETGMKPEHQEQSRFVIEQVMAVLRLEPGIEQLYCSELLQCF